MLVKEMVKAEQPAVKMEFSGANLLSNSELLTIITSALDTEHAHKLLSVGLSDLFYMSTEQIQEISGLSLKKAQQLRASLELAKRLSTYSNDSKIHVNSSEDIAVFLIEEMRYAKQEMFKIVMLNVKSEIVGVHTCSIGNINSSIVDSRMVFAPALKKQVSSIVLAHNHPSGNPEPSDPDISVTKKLIKAGELLDIKVIDHIIIGDGSYVSLKRKRCCQF